jgi:RNA polymerase sigma-70 factor (ECF subfamily)
MAASADLTLGGATIAYAADDELEGLVREHSGFVYRIAFSILRHNDEAEDVVQETFLRVLRHRKELPDIRDRKAWLARIAWRLSLDRRRKAVTLSLDEPHEDRENDAVQRIAMLRANGAPADRVAADRQVMALVEQLIAGLPADLRDALTLSTVEELSNADAAQVLGIPETTVRTRVFRARQILRQKLSAVLGVQAVPARPKAQKKAQEKDGGEL